MQETEEIIESVVVKETPAAPAISVLEMALARLQIMQAGDIVHESWPGRPDVEPTLAQNADGLWMLTVRRQGEHGKFDMTYIGSEILLADAEMGMVVVLVAYHGTETWGRKREKRVMKGQFYRFYQQAETGDWRRIVWRELNDETRQMVLDLEKPAWARQPGKLSSERNPPAAKVIMTSYKVVRLIEGRYYSLYNPDVEYIIGQRVCQAAKPGHESGWFSYPTIEQGTSYLEGCVRYMPFHSEVLTPTLALLEVEIGGRIINYGHKLCSTYLCPVRVLEIRKLN